MITNNMTIVPFACDWGRTSIEVYQFDGTTKYPHGVYSIISNNICEKCGNPNRWLTNGELKCHEWYLHEKLADIDRCCQVGYYYKKSSRQFQHENDILTGHILKIKKQWNLEQGYAKPLGIAMYLTIKNHFPFMLDADIIVPIPNHPEDTHRDAKAVALANELQIQFRLDNRSIECIPALQKVKNISTQGYSRDEKEIIVEDMFEINPSFSVEKKKIILIDDVLTNGIIKGKCASLLKHNGAEKVWGFVAGRNFSVP